MSLPTFMFPDNCIIPVCGTFVINEETFTGTPVSGALGTGKCAGLTGILTAVLGIPNKGLKTGLEAGKFV
jgi:hypothetical protein